MVGVTDIQLVNHSSGNAPLFLKGFLFVDVVLVFVIVPEIA